jgi:hypothetical protein
VQENKFLTFLFISLLVVSLFIVSIRMPVASANTPSYNYYMDVSGAEYQWLSSTQTLISQSTSSSSIFNDIIGACSNGYNVCVGTGSYTVDSTWDVYISGVTVTFASNAILTAVNGLDFSDLFLTSVTNCVVVGGTFDGNAPNQAVSYADGIIILGSHNGIVGATIQHCRQFGLYILGEDSTYNGIENSVISYCGWNGLQLGDDENGQSNMYAINNQLSACSDVAITNYAINDIITGNNILNTNIYIGGYEGVGTGSQWGIGMETSSGGSGSGTYALIAGNTVNGNSANGAGIDLNAGNGYVLCTGNSVSGCNEGITDTGVGNAIFEFNYYYSCVTGLYLQAGCFSDTVKSESYSGCTTNFLNTGGSYGTSSTLVAVTVTSSPTGNGYIKASGLLNNVAETNYAGCAGSYSTSPLTFYNTVGNSVTITANSPVGSYSFSSWIDSGAQSHSITVPSSYTTYTATYTTNGPTPTPTPTFTPNPTPPSGNLMSVTDGNWYCDSDWSHAPIRAMTINYTNTYASSPSWQVPLSTTDWGVDWSPNDVSQIIAPGEVISFSCWIKTSAPTLSADINNPQAGGRLGMDLYGANGASFGVSTPDGTGTSTDSINTYVPFGVSGNSWTKITIEFTVPSTYSANQVTHGEPIGTVFVPTYVIPWVQTWSDTQGTSEHGTAWFSDPTFTITNPSPLPTPTPTPPPATGTFLITQAPFILNYTTGQSFAVQSIDPASTITFTITSGTLNGTGTVTATNQGGAFSINPTTSGTLLVTTTGTPVSVYIGGVYVNNIPYYFAPDG